MPPRSSIPHRLFIAIDLPKPVCRQLGQCLVQPPRGVRPVTPAQMHLTLHFLGDVEDEARRALHDALPGIRQPPFAIAIRGTGVFPPRGRPSVLWAGVSESAALRQLHAAIGLTLTSGGLQVEGRPYVPHITLARLTPAVPRAWTTRFLDATARLAIDDIPVDRFSLYRSTKLDGATEHSVEVTCLL